MCENNSDDEDAIAETTSARHDEELYIQKQTTMSIPTSTSATITKLATSSSALPEGGAAKEVARRSGTKAIQTVNDATSSSTLSKDGVAKEVASSSDDAPNRLIWACEEGELNEVQQLITKENKDTANIGYKCNKKTDTVRCIIFL
jgi:hypothetical protein